MSDLKYPVGKFARDTESTPEKRELWIREIEALPANVSGLVADLSEADLEKTYRPGGWTLRQVVHHLVDSHANAYCRFRLALTEDNPLIKTYNEAAWAELADARSAPVGLSTQILQGLHARWGRLLRAIDQYDFERTLQHPEWGDISLDFLLQLYAWHCRHHLAHIRQALENRA